ncbi:MAG: ATP-binding cassette domain-containing protein [Alphaproteobacteria bacterium]|nr:ATP-binding cassette domain-containing protein [Alphaproteobacteria bacterium]
MTASHANADGPLVAVSDVHVTLESSAGAVNILRGASLTLAAGEAVGLVGPSGSGKSTLLSVVAGLERAAKGRIVIAGHNLGAMDEDALAVFRRHHLGIVFQSFHLVPTMNALENVAIPLELGGARDAFARARERLVEVGLGHRLTHYPAQLSGGEQQRVALARAFAGEPKLVLADEPTGNLDSATGHAIVDLMFRIRADRGTTLLLVTHDTSLAQRCGRVLRMDDGRVFGAVAADPVRAHADPARAQGHG